MYVRFFSIQENRRTYRGLSLAVITVFVTRAAPNRYSLGTMNGLSQTTSSIARAFGPAAFSSLFAFSKESNILGGDLVYLVLLVVAGFLVFLSSLLPDLRNNESDRDGDTTGETT